MLTRRGSPRGRTWTPLPPPDPPPRRPRRRWCRSRRWRTSTRWLCAAAARPSHRTQLPSPAPSGSCVTHSCEYRLATLTPFQFFFLSVLSFRPHRRRRFFQRQTERFEKQIVVWTVKTRGFGNNDACFVM